MQEESRRKTKLKLRGAELVGVAALRSRSLGISRAARDNAKVWFRLQDHFKVNLLSI